MLEPQQRQDHIRMAFHAAPSLQQAYIQTLTPNLFIIDIFNVWCKSVYLPIVFVASIPSLLRITDAQPRLEIDLQRPIPQKRPRKCLALPSSLRI